MENKDFVLNSINQNRHFDFDSTILANKIFNVFMLKWNSVVRETITPQVKLLMGDDLLSEQLKELKILWLNRLFQHGKINVILDKFKKTINNKVLAIPSNFVLAEDLENSQLGEDETQDENRMLETIMLKRAAILQLRIEIETLKKLQGLCSTN